MAKIHIFNKVSGASEAELALTGWNIPFEKAEDGTITVPGNLTLNNMGLTKLPDLSKVIVKGNFVCVNNPELASLKGSPQVVHGTYQCNNNGLTSLEYAPAEVGIDFICWANKLTSLKHAPKKVGRSFCCDNNKLTSLEHAPEIVPGTFNCKENQLTSLLHAPHTVGAFNCCSNKLTSLEHGPHTMVPGYTGKYECRNNPLKSLKGAPAHVLEDFVCTGCKLPTLEGGPTQVDGSYYAYDNELVNLKGSPAIVGKSFAVGRNQLVSIEDGPQQVGEDYSCQDNKLTSLKGAPATVTGFSCEDNPLESYAHAPVSCKGNFWCRKTGLKHLEGIPQDAGKIFSDFDTFENWDAVPQHLRISPETITRQEREIREQREELDRIVDRSTVLQDSLSIKKGTIQIKAKVT